MPFRLAFLVPCVAFIAWVTEARADALRVAVAPAITLDSACAGTLEMSKDSLVAVLMRDLSTHIVRRLDDRGIAAVADSTLGAMLLRLDRVSPDPYDYRKTREHVTASGATRLVYVNDLRFHANEVDDAAADPEKPGTCAFVYNAAVWSASPFARRAYTEGSVPAMPDQGIPAAARQVADWILHADPVVPE